MRLRDVLVYVDANPDSQPSLEAITAFAAAYDARLIGLHVIEVPFYAIYADMPVPAEVLEEDRRRCEAMAARAEQMFAAVTKDAAVRSEWRTVEAKQSSTLVLHARHTDLTAIALGTDSDGILSNRDLVEDAILGSGRPVLVVPHAHGNKPIGTRVVVGWDGGREATRALADALPILERAEAVSVVAVDSHARDMEPMDLPTADICQHLARHDIHAEAQSIQSGDRDIGEALLADAYQQGADLVVIGAYGHSRLREMLLGGVTRHVLSETRIPVLLSC